MTDSGVAGEIGVRGLVGRASAGDRRAGQEVARRLAGPRPPGPLPLVDELARAAARGSRPALELLVAAVDAWGLAGPAVRRLVADEERAAEIHQEVLAAVATGITGFRSESRFTTWLHQVAERAAIAHLRRLREAPGELAGAARPAPRFSSAAADRVDVAAVLAALPARYRDAVILRDVEHLSYAEVAGRLGLPLNTTRTRIARGRALAAAALAGRSGR